MTNTIENEKIFTNNMAKIDPKPYFQAQLGLEGLKIVNGNRIVKIQANHFDVERDENESPPNVIAVSFNDKIETYYANSLPGNLVTDLDKLQKQDFIDKPEEVAKILKEASRFKKTENSISYAFPDITDINLENTRIFVGSEDELIKKFNPSFTKKFSMVYAAMRDGEIAACCVSSRENDQAGEAWIFTLHKYRKQGFGSKAVQLWASELQKNGKLPLYTHKKSNTASQKLAESLKLVKIFETVNYE